METPIVKLNDVDEVEMVYEPAEDSFLLIDTLEKDLESLKTIKAPICMEIGSGSGVVITALALAAKDNWPGYFLAVDINPIACKVTKNVSELNNTNIDVIQMDLISAINLNNIFDIIIFNPPYVVTDTSEIKSDNLISKSWAGGKNGREVMDKLFPFIPKLLTNNGIFYLLTIKENNPHDIINIFKQLNMNGQIVSDRKIRGEHLHVLKFLKQ